MNSLKHEKLEFKIGSGREKEERKRGRRGMSGIFFLHKLHPDSFVVGCPEIIQHHN